MSNSNNNIIIKTTTISITTTTMSSSSSNNTMGCPTALAESWDRAFSDMLASEAWFQPLTLSDSLELPSRCPRLAKESKRSCGWSGESWRTLTGKTKALGGKVSAALKRVCRRDGAKRTAKPMNDLQRGELVRADSAVEVKTRGGREYEENETVWWKDLCCFETDPFTEESYVTSC